MWNRRNSPCQITFKNISKTLKLFGEETELSFSRYCKNKVLTLRRRTIPKLIPEETMRSSCQLVRRTKMEGGGRKAERRIFIWPDRARHPAVNPGRGDKPRDELVDATGSLVLIVRLLLVRVILPPLGLRPLRSRYLSLFIAVASSSLACRFFRGPSSLSRFTESGLFLHLVCSLTAYSLVPGLRRHYRWRALNVFCLFHPRSRCHPRTGALRSPSFVLSDSTFSLVSL